MQKSVLLTFVAICLIGGAWGIIIDWCGLPSCNGRRHITCDLPGPEYSANCPGSAIILDLTNAQTAILAEHNKLRNKLAAGFMQGYDKASHMGTLHWNVTFANLARRNVKLCELVHDGCRNTPDFNFVGQNIGYKTVDTSDYSETKNMQHILDIINIWFDQHMSANKTIIKSYQAVGTNGTDVSAFCQMSRDFATRVGCAGLVYENPTVSTTTLLFTCNYDLVVAKGYPVYDVAVNATTSGTRCTTGMNPDYPHLCSAAENMDPNNFLSTYL